MNPADISAQLVSHADGQTLKLAQDIDRIQTKLRATNTAHVHAQRGLHKLETALSGMGLSIESFSGPSVSDDNLSATCEIQAARLGKKFRFISFRGYTARGAGLNKKDLNQKAAKMEALLANEIFNVISVNPFSLEIEDEKTTKAVLISIRFSI